MRKIATAKLPQLALAKDQAAQIAREEQQEQEIRDFLEEKNILTVPAWVQHYRNLPYPAYLAPLGAFGVADDLTGPYPSERLCYQLHQDAFTRSGVFRFIHGPGSARGSSCTKACRDTTFKR